MLAVVGAALAITAVSCSDDDDGDDGGSTVPSSTDGAGTTSADVAVTSGATTVPEPGPTDPPGLVIGFVAPGPGLLNDLSVGQQRGLDLAVADINAAGGVLGAPVASVSSAQSADRTVDDVVTELSEQGAGVFVGTVGSDSAPELQAAVAERGSLACSASASRPSLTVPDGSPGFFRTVIRDDELAVFVADRIAAPAEGDAPARVAIVGRDDSFGTDLASSLNAQLAARGVETVVVSYPSRRVQLDEEAAEVAASGADAVVAVVAGEAARLFAALVDAGVPAERITGLDGAYVPRLAEQAFPEDPARLDGATVIATTGDRAFTARLAEVPAPQDQVAYAAQMYDCAVTTAVAAIAAGSTDPAAIAEQVGPVTSGGRACSNVADCAELLAAGEDIDLQGPTGSIALDALGDITTGRITTLRVAGGVLEEIDAEDVDLVALARQAVYADAVFTVQVQQILTLLGLYDGEITGVWDDATTQALQALQRQLGVPETGQWDDATDDAFRARYGGLVGGLSNSIEALQQRLTDLGFYTGPIDGRWSTELADAIRALQRQLGVPETAVIDLATLRALQAGAPPAPPATTAPPPPPPPVPTVPPPQPTAPAPTAPPPTDAPDTTLPTPPAADTLWDVVRADPQFSTLAGLIVDAGLDVDLEDAASLTVFAPTNDALAALPPGTLDDLRDDPAALSALLAYHAAEGRYTAAELPATLEALHGGDLVITRDGAGGVFVDGVPIVQADIGASNGIIQAIGGVLAPPTG